MNWKELFSTAVSTRFFLCLITVVASIVYIMVGPLRGSVEALGKVVELIEVVIISYVTGQTLKGGAALIVDKMSKKLGSSQDAAQPDK